MFLWMAFTILILCAMTVSTGVCIPDTQFNFFHALKWMFSGSVIWIGLKLRAIMSSMTVKLLGDQGGPKLGLGRGSEISTPDQTRRGLANNGIRSASSSQADWQRGGSFGSGATPGGGVPRSDSNMSASESRGQISGPSRVWFYLSIHLLPFTFITMMISSNLMNRHVMQVPYYFVVSLVFSFLLVS
jgi:hypothetical protein